MATNVGPDHPQRLTTLIDLPPELILLIAQDLGRTDLLSLVVLCRRLRHIVLPLYFERNGVQRLTTLIDLPTELILLIAEDLEPTDLLKLAVLCRRLHYIALPLYFKRHRVQDIRGNLKVAFTDDYLPGLRVALSLDSAREMEFTFQNSARLPRDMREAAHLISRFTRLDHVRLNFRNITFRQSTTSPWVTNSQHDMTALTSPIRSLLDAVHAKSCRSFTVCYGRIAMNTGESFDLAREMRTPRNVITSLMRKANLGPKEPDWQSPEFPGPPLGSLRTFHFKSNLLLWQPMLNWTFRTFTRSSRSLVKLSFRHLCLQTSDWAYLLPHISLPSLSVLILSTKRLDFSDLILFLRRHPLLKSLCFCGGGLYIGNERPAPLPADLLSGLTRLCGPADYMVHLLQNDAQFPRLLEVDIRPVSSRIRPPGRLARQNEALALVAKLRKPTHITITLFREIIYPHSGAPVLVASEGEPPCSLLNVSWLKLLRADIGFTIHRDPALVARWLALFPALRDVTFSQDFFPLVYEETSKCAFVAEVVAACPNMGHIAFGKDWRSVLTWKRSSAYTPAPNQPVAAA